jgi:hypothetical protein
MNEVLFQVLEILKYIIPALVVFMTIYFMMKKHYQQQYNLKLLEYRQQEAKNILPLKLQAYERLSLFCERIRPDQLIFRLNSSQMKAGDLRTAILISVQKEYEHNLTQQIYVSDSLWKIITLAKNEVINSVTSTSTSSEQSSAQLAEEIINGFQSLKINPLNQAQLAIKKEIELIL